MTLKSIQSTGRGRILRSLLAVSSLLSPWSVRFGPTCSVRAGEAETPPVRFPVQVQVDPRVELFSIIFCLAGDGMYDMGLVLPYSHIEAGLLIEPASFSKQPAGLSKTRNSTNSSRNMTRFTERPNHGWRRFWHAMATSSGAMSSSGSGPRRAIEWCRHYSTVEQATARVVALRMAKNPCTASWASGRPTTRGCQCFFPKA